jgi:hypothetical protein
MRLFFFSTFLVSFNLFAFSQKCFQGELVYLRKDSLSKKTHFDTVFVKSDKAMFISDRSDAVTMSGFTKQLLVFEDNKPWKYNINEEMRVALKQEFHNDCSQYVLKKQDSLDYNVYFLDGKSMISADSNYYFKFNSTYVVNTGYKLFPEIGTDKCSPMFGVLHGYLLESEIAIITENGISSYSKTSLQKMECKVIPDSVFELGPGIEIKEYTRENENAILLQYYLKHKKEMEALYKRPKGLPGNR